MIDWKSIDRDKCCINGIYAGIGGITYFPAVIDGKIEDSGVENNLYDRLKDVAKGEIDKRYPSSTTSWAYLTFLLKSAVCYVEYTDAHGKINKMCACANIELLNNCSEFKDGKLSFKLSDPSSLKKFKAPDINGVMNTSLNVLKVNKKLYTALKMPMYLKGGKIRVAPICLMEQNMKEILKAGGIVRYEYFKDNGDTRTLDTTIDMSILTKHYTAVRAEEMLSDTSVSLDIMFNKGYIRVVELGASKFDSGVRAINVAKIKSYRTITDDEVDYRFIDVDFGGIKDTYHFYIEKIADTATLQKYVNHFAPEVKSNNRAYLLQELFARVDTNITYGSTQYLRTLYLYMLDHPEIFGEAVKPVFNINMGVSSATNTSDMLNLTPIQPDADLGTDSTLDNTSELGTSATNDWGSITAAATTAATPAVPPAYDWGNQNDVSNVDLSSFGLVAATTEVGDINGSTMTAGVSDEKDKVNNGVASESDIKQTDTATNETPKFKFEDW